MEMRSRAPEMPVCTPTQVEKNRRAIEELQLRSGKSEVVYRGMRCPVMGITSQGMLALAGVAGFVHAAWVHGVPGT